jgi:hypothetical protein
MKKSFNQENKFIIINKSKVALREPIGKIHISGYLLDHYKTFNLEKYTILCRLREAFNGLSYFPKPSRIVLDTGQQSRLIYNFEQIVPNIAEDFGIPRQDALEKSVNFFRIHNLLLN